MAHGKPWTIFTRTIVTSEAINLAKLDSMHVTRLYSLSAFERTANDASTVKEVHGAETTVTSPTFTTPLR
jgi:hypothetical protein